MKMTVFRIILIILLLWTFSIIFGFSNQNSEESGSISQKVTKIIVDVLPSTKNLSEQKKEEIVKNYQPVIRKLAHFSIYTFVGILIMSLVSTYNLNLKKRCGMTISAGFLYAVSDEFHQSFIPRQIR